MVLLNVIEDSNLRVYFVYLFLFLLFFRKVIFCLFSNLAVCLTCFSLSSNVSLDYI